MENLNDKVQWTLDSLGEKANSQMREDSQALGSSRAIGLTSMLLGSRHFFPHGRLPSPGLVRPEASKGALDDLTDFGRGQLILGSEEGSPISNT
jgi:hypothetical protein